MKHIKTLNGPQNKATVFECEGCHASCQSACKTSCTVANQKCPKN
ncbi:MAG: six-cysteine ranthipeptide SCIFF [Thermoanaerobacteraceae bacterium]|nr:six-cysteine ranthipeptide SCIFF [Thermoanaerobacteraceae bacterium]